MPLNLGIDLGLGKLPRGAWSLTGMLPDDLDILPCPVEADPAETLADEPLHIHVAPGATTVEEAKRG